MADTVVDDVAPDPYAEDPSIPSESRSGVATEIEVSSQLLTIGGIELGEGNLIKTDTFANNNPPLYGFGSIGSSLVSLDELGMTVGTADTGSIATSVSTGSVEIMLNSLSFGYLPAYTYKNAMIPADAGGWAVSYADSSGQIFFHYSNKIEGDPDFDLAWSYINNGVTTRSYVIGDPVNYDDAEASGLKLKFGTDPTLLPDSTGGIVHQVLSASFDQLSADLLTSYAKSEKAFPRTPPLKVRKKEIGNITTTEATEATTAAPTTTTSTTTGGSGPTY